jgi:hypothetical protein
MAIGVEILPISRANDLAVQPAEQAWLIQSVWAKSAVGIVGGAPKCCKSWFGLDMAVSVASQTPCLGRFDVYEKGPVLIFMAEDALPSIRARIEAICTHRNINIIQLNLFVITASTLRLDLDSDQNRLRKTLAHLKPKFLLLDPLVRLHRLDENSAADISGLLGFIREIQRTYDTAIALVHHSSKKHRAQPGQALRGSSDLHAFGDSNAYLSRSKDKIVLTLEHRAAKPPDPFELQLQSRNDGCATHLAVVSAIKQHAGATLKERILTILDTEATPLTRQILREKLRVNNQRLGDTLNVLNNEKKIVHSSKGWILLPSAKDKASDPFSLELQVS